MDCDHTMRNEFYKDLHIIALSQAYVVLDITFVSCACFESMPVLNNDSSYQL